VGAVKFQPVLRADYESAAEGIDMSPDASGHREPG
jgi:hypothetical protein